MKKHLILSAILCIFALTANTQTCFPTFPEFGYVSTQQVMEDQAGIITEYDYITISVDRNKIVLNSQFWTDTAFIKEWDLEFVRSSKLGNSKLLQNANQIFQFKGRSTAGNLYIIPVVWIAREDRWISGYLTEKLCVGVDYTTYRNNSNKVSKL